MANNARERVHVMLFGGWGYGSNKNSKEVQISHNLFNNAALCIEDIIPESENMDVPLTTIWGKLDSSTPDSVHVRENTVVLVNDILKSLFKNGKCELTRDGIINFLKNHYEEVQIPDEVKIIPMEKYNPLEICQNNLTRKKINLSV